MQGFPISDFKSIFACDSSHNENDLLKLKYFLIDKVIMKNLKNLQCIDTTKV